MGKYHDPLFTPPLNLSLSCTVHGFLEAEYNVLEGDWLNTSFQLNVKGTTQFGDTVAVNGVNGFITATADGTASKELYNML